MSSKSFWTWASLPTNISDGKYAIHHVFTVESRIGRGAAFGSTPHPTDRVAVLRMLVEKGASLDKQDHNGDTVLHLAVRMRQHESVRTLIELGSVVNLKNGQGCSALDLAAKYGDMNLVSLLLDAGACISHLTWRNALESGNTNTIQKLQDEVSSSPVSSQVEKAPMRHSCTENLSPCQGDLFKYFITNGGYPPKFEPVIQLLNRLGITTPHRITIGTQSASSFSNAFKVWWESTTNRRWIWWPLAPCVQSLKLSDAWVQWLCKEV